MSSMARDSTLSVVRHLETTLEEQGLSLIEARQASIGAGMKAREQLRSVEEDLCHRNRRISMVRRSYSSGHEYDEYDEYDYSDCIAMGSYYYMEY